MLSNKFVSATKEYCTFLNHINAPYLRKTFEISELLDSVDFVICGLGFYRLFINGKEITKGHLSPYISNVDQIIYYDKYEISKLLKVGKNVIGIILGNGMLNSVGGYVWDFNKASYRSSPKVAFSLDLNGKVIEADESIKVNKSPITFDDLRAGERYDANLEIEHWNEIDFDDSKWDNAFYVETPKGEKRLSSVEPIIVDREIKPSKIIKSGNGYIYDFNYNSAGVIRLNINGHKNQVIKLLHGEIVKNNRLDLTNIVFKNADENYSQCIYYTCKEGKQVYTPSFTYMGFRYVYVEGIDESQANEDLLTMVVMHSNVERVSDFHCSNDDLNRIFKNTINSTWSNFYHFPTDCPQREKNGWTGDANLCADQIMMNFKASKNLKEWLRNIQKTQLESGQIPGIIPTVKWGYQWGNGPAWDAVIVEIPYRIYQYENDKDVILDNTNMISNYVRYLASRRNDKGLLEYGLGDWCQVEKCPMDFETPLCVSDTIIGINLLDKASLLFGIIGRNDDKEYCLSLSNDLMKAFRKHCIDDNLEVLGHTQSGQAMALYYGAFLDSEKEKAISNLIKYIEKYDNHFNVGVLGCRALFRVLSKYGYSDLALKLITNETFPSYSWQLRFGATSLWESFFNMDNDFNLYQKDMTFEVLSMNHHFWGDVAAYFIEYLAGIKINEKCESNLSIKVKPYLMEGINEVSAYHILPNGKISVSYKINNGVFDMVVNKPFGSECEVCLPNGEILKAKDGENIFSVKLN